VINNGLSDKHLAAFSNVIPIERPVYSVSEYPLDPNWISGFSEGDSSFSIYINSKTNKIQAFYSIGLNEREHPLLIKIQAFFDTLGIIRLESSNQSVHYRVSKLSHLINFIIPHFNQYPLQGNKEPNFIIWSEIVQLMNFKAQRTPEGLALL
jgi:LAGLIDADG endonuclease